MNKAPERIWIEDEFGEGDEDQWTYGTWDAQNYPGYDVEYVRADTVQAQIDAAVTAERERWEAMSQINFANQSTARSIRSIDALIRKGDQP